MLLKKLKSVTLQDAVYDELVQAIISGRIKPGEKITLEQMAKDLDVSIMPVREAIRRLEARKFVTIGKNKRIIATELSNEKIEQIAEIRLILESYAAEKASRIRSDDSINKLEEVHHRYIQSEDIEDLLKYNNDFHSIIYREAKLPLLTDFINSMWDMVLPYFCLDLKEVRKEPKTWKQFKTQTYKFHEGMLDGMKRKDAEAVKNWLVQDITKAANRIGKNCPIDSQKV
jgi:DNA-binding GntR family transcriptional regulator